MRRIQHRMENATKCVLENITVGELIRAIDRMKYAFDSAQCNRTDVTKLGGSFCDPFLHAEFDQPTKPKFGINVTEDK